MHCIFLLVEIFASHESNSKSYTEKYPVLTKTIESLTSSSPGLLQGLHRPKLDHPNLISDFIMIFSQLMCSYRCLKFSTHFVASG